MLSDTNQPVAVSGLWVWNAYLANLGSRSVNDSAPISTTNEIYPTGFNVAVRHLVSIFENRGAALQFRNPAVEVKAAFAELLIDDIYFEGVSIDKLVGYFDGFAPERMLFFGTPYKLIGFLTNAYDNNALDMTQEEISTWVYEHIGFLRRNGRIVICSVSYLLKLFKPTNRNKLPQPGDRHYVDISGFLRQFPPFCGGH